MSACKAEEGADGRPSATDDNAAGRHSGEQACRDLVAGVINALLDYCTEERTRSELQEFCGIRSRDYFRRSILVPLLDSGRLKRTIPDKPNSNKQKYIKS